MFRRLPDPNLLPWREDNARDFIKALRQYLALVANQLNTQIQDVGPDLASAAVMKPSNAIHYVTGVAAIDTIVAPIGFSGFIRFVVGGAWSTTTADNIAAAIAPVVGTVVVFDYIPKLSKWFPNA